MTGGAASCRFATTTIDREHPFGERAMSNKTIPNGQTRKTLASQLDRLDTILDTLGDGLNQAVASAVEQAVSTAVHRAVQGVIAEVLTNPDLLALLRAAAAPGGAEGAAADRLRGVLRPRAAGPGGGELAVAAGRGRAPHAAAGGRRRGGGRDGLPRRPGGGRRGGSGLGVGLGPGELGGAGPAGAAAERPRLRHLIGEGGGEGLPVTGGPRRACGPPGRSTSPGTAAADATPGEGQPVQVCRPQPPP